MSSIKISALNKLPFLHLTDYFPIDDSGSATTYQTDMLSVLNLMSISGSCQTASYATRAVTASYAITSSYSISSSHALYADVALSSSYSLSSSFAATCSGSGNAATSSFATVSENARGLFFNRNSLADYPYLMKWSSSRDTSTGGVSSYQTTADKASIIDYGPQINIGVPVFFNVDAGNNRNFAELSASVPYKQWLTLSYTAIPSASFTGSFYNYNDPTQLPNGNIRYIPSGSNVRDESGIGSQINTLYFRSSRYFAFYQGGSAFGHSSNYLSPGISGSSVMVISNGNLGIGNFTSGSITETPATKLHVTGSTSVTDPLLRLDQITGSAGGIGSIAGYLVVNINGTNLKLPLYL